MIARWWVVLIGCSHPAPPIAIAPVPSATPSASVAPMASIVPVASTAPHPPVPTQAIVYRVLSHTYVENDAGVPIDMSITFQIEAGGTVLGPFTFGEPGCTAGPPPKGIASMLSCYYAGAGTYVEIREKTPGFYVVVSYAQSESYADEPNPPKRGLKTIGTFKAAPKITGDDVIVNADGSRYKPYE